MRNMTRVHIHVSITKVKMVVVILIEILTSLLQCLSTYGMPALTMLGMGPKGCRVEAQSQWSGDLVNLVGPEL